MDGGETIAPGGRADRGIQTRRAKGMEKTLGESVALHETHRSGIAVRHDPLRISGGHLPEPCRDLRDRDLPRDRFKLPGSLGADPTQRLGQSIRMVGPLRIARDFRAQNPIGRGMVWIPLDANDPIAADRDPQGTGIGTIMWAGAAHRAFLFSGHHGEYSKDSVEVRPGSTRACQRSRLGGWMEETRSL